MKKILLTLLLIQSAFFLSACTEVTDTTTVLPTTITPTTMVPPTTTTTLTPTTPTTVPPTTITTTMVPTTTVPTTTTSACKAQGYDYDYNSLTYDLVWSDEFDGSSLSLIKWRYQTGGWGWGNNELQYYTDGANTEVADGHLTITARKETFGTNEYTSARVNTVQSFLYGKIEVRAILPSGLGTWPAIWMMPTYSVYGIWPNSGEIDIMEHVGKDLNRVHHVIHTQAYNHQLGTQKGSSSVVADATEAFHVYKLEWLPDMLMFFVDDTLIWIYDPNDYTNCPASNRWPFDKHFYLIMNIAIGGWWPGDPSPSFEMAEMIIDYVRIYQSPEITALG